MLLFQKKRILKKLSKSINYQKVRYNCQFTGNYRGAAHSICHLEFNVPNEIPLAFRDDSNYDYHFIIKELANKFEGQFECLGEKHRKVQNFFCSNRKRNYKY